MTNYSFRLRELREKNGFTTKQVAFILDITERTYKKKEAMGMLRNLEEATKLAILYRVRLKDLLIENSK